MLNATPGARSNARRCGLNLSAAQLLRMVAAEIVAADKRRSATKRGIVAVGFRRGQEAEACRAVRCQVLFQITALRARSSGEKAVGYGIEYLTSIDPRASV